MIRCSLVLGCCFLGACTATPAAQSARDLVLVGGTPRCPKLGIVEGAGGSAQVAEADALDQASAHGATHVQLRPARLDLEDGMTMVVTCTMFKCPPPGQDFPPNGYP